MKMNSAEFVAAVRKLPLSAVQVAAVNEALAAPAPKELPAELVRREVLTEYQMSALLAGKAADLLVGRYVILDELGTGGMGQVFRARDTAMDRVIALKLIRPDRLANADAYNRFQQEIRAAARLAHPNIVRAYDAGTLNGKHFLATEFVAGHDLAHELARRGAFPPGEACEYVRQAAAGLQHAHEKGLVHRDIKPANLLFSTSERFVKIADFGLARLDQPTATAGGLTADGTVMGTPDYIAPEQADSAAKADIRSDLYSLGCTLYHFLTGHVPFPDEGLMKKLVGHASHEPIPLDDSCPGLSAELVGVVRKLMAKNPAARFQTPLEVVDALIPFCPKPRTSTASLNRPPVPPHRAEHGGSPVPPHRAEHGGSHVPTGTLPHIAAPSAVAPQAVRPTVAPASTLNHPPRVAPPRPPALPPPMPVTAPLPPDPEPTPVRHNRGLLYAGIGLGAGAVVALAAVIVVLVFNKKSDAPPRTDPAPTVNVNVPVNVTVKIDDWARAREPGVVIYLGGAGLAAAERDKPRTAADLARPLELPPGRYTLVAKKDGKELEARAFEVTPESAGAPLVPRVVALPDPAGAPGEIRRWTAPAAVTDLVYAASGRRFAALAGRIQIHDPDAAAPVGVSADTPPAVTRLALTKNGEAVMTIRGTNQRYAATFYHALFDTGGSSTNPPHPAPGVEDWTYPLWTGSPDGKRLLWAQVPLGGKHPGQLTVSLVWTENGYLRWKEKGRFPGAIGCFHPTAERVLTAEGKALRFHDENTGKPIEPTYTGPTVNVGGVAVSPDGARIAAAAGDTAYVWNAGTATPIATCKGHAGAITGAVAFTPDGARLVTGGADGTVRVWEVPSARPEGVAATGKEVHQFKPGAATDKEPPVGALAVSPGGKRVVSAADKTIYLWQLP